MRLFIALELPEHIKEHLKEVQARLKEAASSAGARCSFANDFHLTLKFLGDIKEFECSSIKNALDNVKFFPIKSSLSGIGFFPSKNNPRVVWIGLNNADKICALQKDIDPQLPSLNPEEDFKPHITLARVKLVKDKKLFEELVHRLNVEKREFLFEHLTLFSSTLTSEGSVYTIVKRK